MFLCLSVSIYCWFLIISFFLKQQLHDIDKSVGSMC